MDRRDFLQLAAASGSFFYFHPALAGQTSNFPDDNPFFDIFPSPPAPERLSVAALKTGDVEERHLFQCLQGLVNRTAPRIYYLASDTDRLWLDYYGERYGIGHDALDSARDLFELHRERISGYIVYDAGMPDSRNIATLMGGLSDALPVSPRLVPMLKELGLEPVEDLRGRWKDRYEAYSWALEEMLPRANRRMLGMNCVDEPHWPSQTVNVDDYYFAHNLFTFDLSACRRDRADRDLLARLYDSIEKPACLIGWRSARTTEHEMVGFAARRNIIVLCALGVMNFTIHTAIPRLEQAFEQDHSEPDQVGPVEKKVYISFMNTDGDSLNSMMRLQSGRFLEPEHGALPYTWGFLPLAYDLMPGVARLNYERRLPNDYFACATCGAVYTYPYLLPDKERYLEYTAHYMDKTGLRTAYMSNWDDDFWWQEMDAPGFHEDLCKAIPDSIGFVRGMGESPFEPHLWGECAPYIYCGEGIHSDSDIHETLKEFIEANPNRPLFIYCLVNHGTTLARMMETVERLAKGEAAPEYVRLDRFFHLLNLARKEKLIGDELYPDKSGVREILAKEARKAWPKQLEKILQHAQRAEMSEAEFRRDPGDDMTRLILERSRTPAGDIVAFDAIWDSMHLTRLALNLKGIYVNNKAKGAEEFEVQFTQLPGSAVVGELWKLWEEWEGRQLGYNEGAEYSRQLAEIAKRLDSEIG